MRQPLIVELSFSFPRLPDFFWVSRGCGMFCFLRGETKQNDVSLFYSCACIYVCMYVCVYVRMCVYVCVCTYVCMYVCMFACICGSEEREKKKEIASWSCSVDKARMGESGRRRLISYIHSRNSP